MKITHMKTIGLSAILALLVCSFGAYAEETKEETQQTAKPSISAYALLSDSNNRKGPKRPAKLLLRRYLIRAKRI